MNIDALFSIILGVFIIGLFVGGFVVATIVRISYDEAKNEKERIEEEKGDGSK